MIQKFKTKLIILASVLALALPLAVPAVASADNISDNVCNGAYNLQLDTSSNSSSQSGCKTTTDAGDSFNAILTNVVNIFSVIVGIIAVIMIIVGGFKFITSGGQSEGVASARKTIMYALVGLVIVILAQVIVHFVIGRVAGIGGGS